MNKRIVITLQSRKGTQWDLKTDQSKLTTVKNNANKMGYKIIKVGE